MDLQDYAEWLLQMAEARGNRGEVLELLTKHTGLECSIAAYLECGLQLLELAKGLDTEALRLLNLCGVKLSWLPVDPAAPFPTLAAEQSLRDVEEWLNSHS